MLNDSTIHPMIKFGLANAPWLVFPWFVIYWGQRTLAVLPPSLDRAAR